MTDRLALRRYVARLDVCHSFVYFRPEAGLEFAGLGITGMDAYFASRAAPMGAVDAGAVVATFHNFQPGLVAHAMPSVWATASPATVLDARLRAADGALRTMLGDLVDGDDVAEAADLLRSVIDGAEAAGRPIYAGNAQIAWPDAAHLRLFHAVTLLREHRGDAHVAALTLAGIGGAEALVYDVAAGRSKMPESMVRATRGWSDEEWADAVERVRARGHLGDDGLLNEAGLALREDLEVATDGASLDRWDVLGDDGIERVKALTHPLITAIAPKMFG